MDEMKKKRAKADKIKSTNLRSFWRSTQREGGVTKLETGIKGFDELLEGGLPEGRATLVSAGPGCGKTVLLSEYVYRGAAERDEPGIFLTFEERPEDIVHNLRNFGWNLDELIDSDRLVFLDASPPPEGEVALGPAEWLEPTLARIAYTANKIGARRLAIDNLGAVFLRYGLSDGSGDNIRENLFRFSDGIKHLGLTTLISTERQESQASLAQYGVEEFVTDGLLELETSTGQGAELRTLHVRKLRGCGYRSGKVVFEITQDGLEIFPKIPIDTSIGETNFDIREGFGIPALDKAMGGGIPEGHILLVAGNTGTGKSTLGLHFVREGLQNDQACVWVALEEPVQQVLKTAHSHGWELEGHIKDASLVFITTPLMDLLPDKLLYRIIDAVNATGAKRIVVDSISSMESASMTKEGVREFMMQLAGFAKTLGLTVVMNYLSGETFGAGKNQLLGSMMTNAMRLSSIVDGIILLRYVERDQGVHKLLNILKLRGSSHIKDILSYEIRESGLVLGKRFGIDA